LQVSISEAMTARCSGAAVGACEERIFPVEDDRTDGAFEGAVVELDTAVIKEARQSLPTRERIADGVGELALLTDQTKLCAFNVIKYGANADLLIDEVAIASPELALEPFIQRIMAHHTTACGAGTVFARTRPKLAAYTHMVFLASEKIPPATVGELLAETRRTYNGPLEVGEDLMRFEIGQSVSVQRFSSHRPA